MRIFTSTMFIDQYELIYVYNFVPLSSPNKCAMAETSESEREFISMLINLYRDLPELWKVKSKDYFNQTKKQLAFKKSMQHLFFTNLTLL